MDWKIHHRLLHVVGLPFRMLFRGFRWVFRKTDEVFRTVASRTEESGTYRFLRLLEAVAIVVTIIAFWVGWGDRQADRHNRAWSLIAAGAGVENIGNVGLRNALEILDGDGVSLDRVQLPGAWLSGVKLSGADLGEANLSGANFSFANLSRADLNGANLAGANFSGTNLQMASFRNANLERVNLQKTDISGADFYQASLRNADLQRANLSGVDLFRTDLTGAKLLVTNLSGADLRAAKGLTQTQIDAACYNKNKGKVLLPDGLEQPSECPTD